MEAAEELNAWIKRTVIGPTFSVRLLEIYNGHHARQADHALIKQILLKDVANPEIRSETINPGNEYVTVNMSGDQEQVLARLKDQLIPEEGSAVSHYRQLKLPELEKAVAGKLILKEYQEWLSRFGQAESVAGVDEMLAEARDLKKKKTKRKKGQGCCFLTTACVEFAGMDDDCHELTVLRGFRDGYMANMENGAALIAEYYAIAPGIVERIDRRGDRGDIYGGVLSVVMQCVAEIENLQMAGAYARYRHMVLELQASV